MHGDETTSSPQKTVLLTRHITSSLHKDWPSAFTKALCFVSWRWSIKKTDFSISLSLPFWISSHAEPDEQANKE